MKNKFKLINVFLGVIILMLITGCVNSKEVENMQDNSNTTTNIEDHFEWDGNLIVGLTDEGARQESLVIPERCEGFNASIFLDKENNVKSVSFESDKDIDLRGVFYAAETVEYIYLPSNLTEIGPAEFGRCESLKEITIPKGVSVIEGGAFKDNTSLEKIVLQSNITSIGAYAFEGCSGLSSIDLPDTITSIGDHAFYECTSLKEVTLPKSLKEVGQLAFGNSGLETINVPAELQLTSYNSTAFVQLYRVLNVNVVAGSWADLNFDSVFENENKNIVTNIP